jgi:two-component system NtrC family sensor kinase
MKYFFPVLALCLLLHATFLDAQNPHKVDSLLKEIKKYDAVKKDVGGYTYSLRDTLKANMLWDAYMSSDLSDLKKLKEYIAELKSVSEHIGYKKGIANALTGEGVISGGEGEFEKSLKLHIQAMKIRKEINHEWGIAWSYFNIGYTNYTLSNFPVGMENLQKALVMFIRMKDTLGIQSTYIQIGSIFYEQGNYPDAISNFLSAQKESEKHHDKKNLASAYLGLGSVYLKQKKYPEALINFNACLDVHKQIGCNPCISGAYQNIGSYYEETGNYDEALKNYRISLGYVETAGYMKFAGYIYYSIGNVYAKQGKYNEALKNLFSAKKNTEDLKDISELARDEQSIGNVYLKLKNFGEAEKFLASSVKRACEVGAKDVAKESYALFVKLDSARHDFKNAFDHHKLFIAYRDSVLNDDNNRKTLQSQLQFDYDKKHLADSLQFDQSKKLSEEKYRRQRTATYGGFGALALVAMLLFFVIRSNVKQRKTNKLLKETQQQLVQQEKLASLGALTAGIAHEIQNPLNFINNFSELSAELIEEIRTITEETQRHEILSDLNQNLIIINHHGKRADNIVKNMLRHSRGTTGELQLTDLNALCEESLNLSYHAMRSTHPEFNSGIEKRLSTNLPHVKIMHQDISRVVLNLVNNAFFAVMKKSAEEKETSGDRNYKPMILLSTYMQNGSVTVSVKDNGGGIPKGLAEKIFEPFFTTKPSGQGTGLGLSISYDIIKAHGGKLTVANEENKGATFMIVLPG